MNRTTFLLHRLPSLPCARRHKSPLGQLYTFLKISTTSPAVAMATVDLSNYNSEQAKLMQERCILVNENDQARGTVDKKDCKCSGLELERLSYRLHPHRSLDGKHQHRHATSCFLCFPLQTVRRKALASTTSI